MRTEGLHERIEAGPGWRGQARIRGTRITVSAILGRLADGLTDEEVLGELPHLKAADVHAALAYGATVAEEARLEGRVGPEEIGQRFETAFEHAPIGIALIDMQSRWIQVNAALCRILGSGGRS